MPILRAGPWGNLSNPHEDEPAIIDEDTDIYPVNCAKDDWPNQPWGSLYTLDKSFGYLDPYEYGLASLGQGKTVTSDVGSFDVAIDFLFCYQATEEFTINFNWAFSGAGAATNFPSLYWAVTLIDGTSDSYFNTPADSGTEIITLPATTLGLVYANIQGYDYESTSTLTLTSSLSA